MAKTYTLCSYIDAWGNKNEGWKLMRQHVFSEDEIASYFGHSDTVITEEMSQDDVIDWLIEIGFLKEEARYEVEIVEAFMDSFEVVEKETGRPICGLKPNHI